VKSFHFDFSFDENAVAASAQP